MFEFFQKKYQITLPNRITLEDINKIEEILKSDTFYANEFLKFLNNNHRSEYSFTNGAIKQLHRILD